MAGTTETGRRDEAVIKAVSTVRKTEGSKARLSAGLVKYIDTVAPTMAAGDGGRLSIKPHAHPSDAAELTHGTLLGTESIHAHAHGEGAVHATMCVAARGQAGGLEGQHLV